MRFRRRSRRAARGIGTLARRPQRQPEGVLGKAAPRETKGYPSLVPVELATYRFVNELRNSRRGFADVALTQGSWITPVLTTVGRWSIFTASRSRSAVCRHDHCTICCRRHGLDASFLAQFAPLRSHELLALDDAGTEGRPARHPGTPNPTVTPVCNIFVVRARLKCERSRRTNQTNLARRHRSNRPWTCTAPSYDYLRTIKQPTLDRDGKPIRSRRDADAEAQIVEAGRVFPRAGVGESDRVSRIVSQPR